LKKYRKSNKNRKLLNVLQFGHVIYESALGYAPDDAIPLIPASTPKNIQEVLFIFKKFNKNKEINNKLI